MKTFFTCIFLVVVNFVFSQINYSNFDSETFNKKLLISLNKMRRDKGLDTLVPSKSVFNIFSKPNCIEVSNSNSLYHPSNTERYKNSYLRGLIIDEFKNQYGGQSILLNTGIPKMDMNENCLKTNKKFYDYESLVDATITAWTNSQPHDKIQNLVYSSSGLPGVFSCHSVMKNDGTVYVFVNYVKIFRL
jgi:hypothetical protein